MAFDWGHERFLGCEPEGVPSSSVLLVQFLVNQFEIE